MEYKVIREFGLQQKQEVAAIFMQQSHAQAFVEGKNQKKADQDKYKVLAREARYNVSFFGSDIGLPQAFKLRDAQCSHKVYTRLTGGKEECVASFLYEADMQFFVQQLLKDRRNKGKSYRMSFMQEDGSRKDQYQGASQGAKKNDSQGSSGGGSGLFDPPLIASNVPTGHAQSRSFAQTSRPSMGRGMSKAGRFAAGNDDNKENDNDNKEDEKEE
jgi:hypothetical protein